MQEEKTNVTNEEVSDKISEEVKEEMKAQENSVNEEAVDKENSNQQEAPKKEEKKGIFKKKEDLEKKKLQEENAQLKDKFLRVNAEMQNMRRRMEEEKTNLLKYEGEDLIKRLLPIVDNFERAIGMDDTNLEDEVSKFLSGFKMIYGNLNNTLQGYEVIAMDSLNKPFDPNTMEAVMLEEVEGMEPNIVVDVLQKGYTYKGKVIRHAMVKVSK
ncbi:MAG TPA: nucleotide exchange factor GrpE [Firmicutes bacterium]|nr:nucleotide exchange factor GrpE [Bacillota bacterium]